ncbi:odorant receptor 13a-like [Cotesia typhae]|uniref:odorant receptor 13a-like n=1 Tax=Cotesia typhae TaxID=2053667 RepID=UPI003D697520
MDIFDQPCYKTTKNLATLIGRWPYQPQKQSSIIITILWIGFFLQAIPQSFALVMYADDREVFIEAISTYAVDIVLAAKYLNATYHAKLIRNLFDKVQRDWKLVMNDEEKRVLQYHSEIGRLLTIGYTVFIFGIIACDVIFITLLQHICGQFAVLGHRIENTPTAEITTKNGKEEFSNSQKIYHDVSYQHLVSCIQMHTRAIEFAELLEECFAMSFGVLVGLNLPMISLTGFQIITQSNTVQQILKGLTFICGQMLHLFFDCYMSQKLNDSSSQIAQSIANVDWYKQSIRSQKLLVVMTVRSQVPCKLTASKIMDLSIENYAMMLKTAGSYFTMLLSMQ